MSSKCAGRVTPHPSVAATTGRGTHRGRGGHRRLKHADERVAVDRLHDVVLRARAGEYSWLGRPPFGASTGSLRPRGQAGGRESSSTFASAAARTSTAARAGLDGSRTASQSLSGLDSRRLHPQRVWLTARQGGRGRERRHPACGVPPAPGGRGRGRVSWGTKDVAPGAPCSSRLACRPGKDAPARRSRARTAERWRSPSGKSREKGLARRRRRQNLILCFADARWCVAVSGWDHA